MPVQVLQVQMVLLEDIDTDNMDMDDYDSCRTVELQDLEPVLKQMLVIQVLMQLLILV
jgi:hypothetical protein